MNNEPISLLKLSGLFLALWAGASVLLVFWQVTESAGMTVAEAFAAIDWKEIASRGFFYGAIALAVYNLYTRKKRHEQASE